MTNLENMRLSVDNNHPISTIIKNETTTELIILYHHSSHQISVIGSDATPEFPSMIVTLGVLAAIIAGIVVVSRRSRSNDGNKVS